VQFKLFRTNGLLWSLAACAFTVPLLDWLLPANRYAWNRESFTSPSNAKSSVEKALNYEPAVT
jgi:hypothetical protein